MCHDEAQGRDGTRGRWGDDRVDAGRGENALTGAGLECGVWEEGVRAEVLCYSPSALPAPRLVEPQVEQETLPAVVSVRAGRPTTIVCIYGFLPRLALSILFCHTMRETFDNLLWALFSCPFHSCPPGCLCPCFGVAVCWRTRRVSSILMDMDLFGEPTSSALTFLRIFTARSYMLDVEVIFGARKVLHAHAPQLFRAHDMTSERVV